MGKVLTLQAVVSEFDSQHPQKKEKKNKHLADGCTIAPRPPAGLNGELQVQGEDGSPQHRWRVAEEHTVLTSGKPETKYQVRAAGRGAAQEKAAGRAKGTTRTDP